MSRNRIHHLIAAGLVATIGLLLVLKVQVGVTAAATDRSAASSSGALRGRVVIRCKGRTTQPPVPARGLCKIRGAITDRGTFVDGDRLHIHPHDRTLFGTRGTIRMSVYREHRGHWRIFGGTRAYAGLRGRGWESLSCRRFLGARCGTIALTMTGTVSQ
jgi:hypothetical protein